MIFEFRLQNEDIETLCTRSRQKKHDPEKARPASIHENEWTDWLTYWDSEKVKAKPKMAKKC